MTNNCRENTAEAFFANREEQFSIYKAIRSAVKLLGPINIEVMKSQISFGAKRKFAWVWLPKAWARRPKNSLVLTIGLKRKISSYRIAEAIEPYPGRWTHHIIMESEDDLDEDVLSWLQEAYRSAQSE